MPLDLRKSIFSSTARYRLWSRSPARPQYTMLSSATLVIETVLSPAVVPFTGHLPIGDRRARSGQQAVDHELAAQSYLAHFGQQPSKLSGTTGKEDFVFYTDAQRMRDLAQPFVAGGCIPFRFIPLDLLFL